MARIQLKQIARLTIAACCVQSAYAADPAPPDPPKPPEKTVSPYGFALLPLGFQKHPVLAISVITEMTDEGRKRTPPTAENPTYYYTFSAGYLQVGQGVAEEGKVSKDNLKKQIEGALATSGYLPGSKEHPATQVLFFVWGLHSKFDPEMGDGSFEDIGHENLLSRATLVGGSHFAKELAKALKQQDLSGGPTVPIFDPVYRFTHRDDLTRNLMEQTLHDCYYVVISAYDGTALAHGEKILLWRTKMSTSARGVSLVETTSALVASGGPFFGHEMTEASIVGKRISRGSKVEFGELKVLGYEDKTAEPATPPAKK